MDYQDRWMDWIHQNFNNNSTNPEDGKYALQLLLRWSPLKLVIWSSIPIIFSLAIGLWYMISPHPGEDYVAVVQTAWTIASYIITTAAGKRDVKLDFTQD
jgi:cytochrome b subunit of formate dehydrogenase